MNPYTIIIIAGIWAVVLIISIAAHQHGMRKKNTIEKKLTQQIDKLRHDAFIQHKDFDTIAKKRLATNQHDGYTQNRQNMRQEAQSIGSEETIKTIDREYHIYKKTSTYARIASIIANICSIGIYRILA